MPVESIILSVVVDAAIGDMVAAEVGTEILGSTVLADATTGAIKGAVSGAVTAAATGGDVGTAIEKGAVGGAVSGAVTPAATKGAEDIGIPKDYTSSAGKAVGGITSGLSRGEDIKTAATRGVITGGVDYLFGPAPEGASATDKAILGIEKGLATQAIGDIFVPTSSRSSQTLGGGYTPQTSVTTTGSGQAPGSQALAQALRIGDPGAPIFGGDKDKEGAKQSGWNVESLRYMGQES